MNINQLFRTFAKDMRPVAAGQLELKVGQIVRGVVLKPLDGQDALVNIGGTVVRAQLEAPLKQGEATMLQVQPESTQGKIVLKPLQSSVVPIAEESLASLLEGMGLQDRQDVRQLVQQMHQSGIPLSKENIEQLASLLTGATGADAEEWNQAAVIAFQRKLPLTPEVVGALRQALQSESLTQRLDRLGGLLSAAVQSAASADQAPSPALLSAQAAIRAVNEMAAKVISSAAKTATLGAEPTDGTRSGGEADGSLGARAASLLAGGQPAAGQAEVRLPGAPTAGGAAGLPQANGGGGASSAASNAAVGQAGAGSSADSHSAASALAAQSAGAAVAPPTIPAVAGATARQQLAPGIAGSGVPQSAAAPAASDTAAGASQPQTAAPAQPSAAAPGVAASPAASAGQFEAASSAAAAVPAAAPQPAASASPQPAGLSAAAQPSAAQAGEAASAASSSGGSPAAGEPDPSAGNIVSRLLHALGFSHENLASRLPAAADLPQGGTAAAQPLAAPADDAALSLKHALLQLASADDIPAAIKDSAQQIVQQLNGQQLLLSADRAAVFSQITMFIPFADRQGSRTASVHIQARKGSRGEIDADNCRLLFDLDMQAIGNTMVDVQVVDRIVSFQVMNDHPLTAAVLESERDEIGAALNRIGYKFISMKISPYPDRASDQPAAAIPASPSSAHSGLDPRSLYKTRPYKGVDVRV